MSSHSYFFSFSGTAMLIHKRLGPVEVTCKHLLDEGEQKIREGWCDLKLFSYVPTAWTFAMSIHLCQGDHESLSFFSRPIAGGRVAKFHTHQQLRPDGWMAG
eukprot:TRINITY_DN7986_c0_g2_i1.p1 TRINITY_DN7986_c0_g2~~TRINITY_DN7986_c0_g2_i1.p1  ORF type:complete len:102 (-),score=5.83 TRINITY_DN7986_c0_g2_i1:854-1159(-)